MSVDAIGGSSPYTNIASGLRINSAADDPAGLSIAKGMNAQIVSAEQNLDNVADMSNALNTAEGSLGSIQDSLGRIRELAVQASNGILNADDKGIIQNEIDELLSGIESVSKNTEFNTKPLLDGSFTNVNTAQETDGTGTQISIADSSLSALGIEGFDVTGSFDLNEIDDAMEKVSEARSDIGSATNAFEHASNSISGKINNITASMSKIQDANIAEEISSLKKNQILDQYKIQMQAIRQQNEQQKVGMYADFKL